MLPYNLTSNGPLKLSFPKTDYKTLQSARHIILESSQDSILSVHGAVILKVAHYRTGKLMPMRFFIVDSKHEVMILHAGSTQLGLLDILYHNRIVQYRHLDAITKHTFQPENTSTTATIHPFQNHNTTFYAFKTIKLPTALKAQTTCSLSPLTR